MALRFIVLALAALLVVASASDETHSRLGYLNSDQEVSSLSEKRFAQQVAGTLINVAYYNQNTACQGVPVVVNCSDSTCCFDATMGYAFYITYADQPTTVYSRIGGTLFY